MLLAIKFPPLNASVMGISLQPHVRWQSIGSDGAPGFNHLSDEPMQRSLMQIQDPAQPDPSHSSASNLNSYHNQRLFFDFPAYYALFLGSPVCLVHFHRSMKLVPAWPYHCPPQFVQHCPRGLVTAKPQNPLQAQRTDPIFLAGHVPHGAKPSRQRQVRILKHRSGHTRYLTTTRSAHPTACGFHAPCFAPTAPGTHKSTRPPKFLQVFSATRFRRKTAFQFHHRSRIVFHTPTLWVGGG